MRKRVLILGAAGRDFHNFNVVYRDQPAVEVVAFTAAQIPGISKRRYPPELAGRRTRRGFPSRSRKTSTAWCASAPSTRSFSAIAT